MSVLNKDFAELTADGSTETHNIPLSKEYLFYAQGDFDGGAVFLESTIDGGATFYVIGGLPEPGRCPLKISSGELIRATLVGSNGAASVFSGVRE